ncbi:hypothetical protein DCC85_08140 [Paenibacillus sp. CAA11]|uniref:hypothetical protein n=1 Tax=Paenibacillus sp. CAA11 TaxID=1532905 RepID=UPI000D3C2FA3|nr:hypothetical protein [Paenibacillus sp. CAA11]AWB44193.1 hypothetical protein DCC85_08140 [Paenibacillus sp. CAA11]
MASISAQGIQQQAVPAIVEKFAADILGSLTQQQAFSSLREATPSFDPLGPGTHGWLVTLKKGSQIAGYLIISAKPDGGLFLSEYGLGSEPLFDLTKLAPRDRPAVQITPMYYGPAYAEWKLTKLSSTEGASYFAAGTGEQLPVTDADWNKLAARPFAQTAESVSYQDGKRANAPLITASAFDPYSNLKWIVRENMKISNTTDFLRSMVAEKKLVFAANDQSRSYSLALPIFGLQTWSNTTNKRADAVFVLTGTADSSRWIELNSLLSSGKLRLFES